MHLTEYMIVHEVQIPFEEVPSALQVATASIDHTARIWNIATGECLMSFIGHEDQARLCLPFVTDMESTESLRPLLCIPSNVVMNHRHARQTGDVCSLFA